MNKPGLKYKKCVCCGEVYNVSRYCKVLDTRYVCPRCRLLNRRIK